MANVLHPDVLDGGLAVLDAAASDIYIVSADPTNYNEATSILALGHRTFGAGSVFGGLVDGVPNGRMVTSMPITDGTVTVNGTATGWAVVDAGGQRLLANGDLAAPQAVVAGHTFSLAAFNIRIPNQ